MDGFLIKQEVYLESGIHIGTKIRLIDMNQFIYKKRNDGLYVLDLKKIDERIRLAGKLLAQYEPEDILVVASRTYSANSASVFSKYTGIKVLKGRFIPGILTNVYRQDFLEPKIILICDPKGEKQAVLEAGKMGIPTIGLCDTDNSTSFIDFVVPCNNKGKRSLALIFYLLTREYLMGKNKISSYSEFTVPLSAFEGEKEEEQKEGEIIDELKDEKENKAQEENDRKEKRELSKESKTNKEDESSSSDQQKENKNTKTKKRKS
jgi:small subunit ribosomal protein S2